MVPRMGMSERKWRIFSAAVECIAETGYDRASIEDMAAAAGVSPGGLYYHFPSKASILEDIYRYYETYFDQRQTAVDELLARADAGEDTETLLMSLIAMPDDPELTLVLRRMFIIVATASYTEPRAAELFERTMYRRPREALRPLLGRLIELGRVRPFEVEAYLSVFCAMWEAHNHAMARVYTGQDGRGSFMTWEEWIDTNLYLIRRLIRPVEEPDSKTLRDFA